MTAPRLTVSVQGIGATSADQLNTYMQACRNFAQLRSFTGAAGITVYVYGAVSPGDGSQGLFYWNEASPGPDNNSTIIVPTGALIGAWVYIPPR